MVLNIVTITTYWKSNEVASHNSVYEILFLQPASKYFGIIIGIGVLFLVLGLMMRSSKIKIRPRSPYT